jgi:uncharacterized membrane protein
MTALAILILVVFIVMWRRQSSLEKFLLSRIAELERTVLELKIMSRYGAADAEKGHSREAETERERRETEPSKPKAEREAEQPPPLPPEVEKAVAERKERAEPVSKPPKKVPPVAAEPVSPGEASPVEEQPARTVPETPKQKPKRTESEFKRRWNEFVSNVDWELFTGVKLFAWLGGLALFVGAGFFVKYSIDRNLIPPTVRLAAGALTGIGLILSALRFDRERYETLRHTLVAGGVGVLYTVVFAATVYYEYLPKTAGFFVLCLVSAAAFVLAVFHRGISISVLGALGAYATPVLVSTGQGGLVQLFAYLVIVNLGLFEVMRRLGSSFLLLFAAAGTSATLLLGTFGSGVFLSSETEALVWILNLALFSFFVDFIAGKRGAGQALSWSWNATYWTVLAVAATMVDKPSVACLLVVTAATAGATALAFRNRFWYARCVPYSVLAFFAALGWAVLEFDPRGFSMQFAVFLLYGAAGGIGPVLLIRKYGPEKASMGWLKAFPLAVTVLAMAMLFKWPAVDFWFWPMVLLIQMVGVLVSLIIGALIQVGLLTAVMIAGGIFWMRNAPAVALGAGFFVFLLAAGVLMLAITYFALRFMSGWISAPGEGRAPEDGKAKSAFDPAEWMKASPVLGAFVLLGVAFWMQRPLNPQPGMATLACFTAIAVFLGKRIAFSPLAMVALLAACLAESVWMFSPPAGTEFSALAWSIAGFVLALSLPFVFFRPVEHWDRIWMAWSVFEIFQAAFVFRASDFLWGREVSGCLPAAMAAAKIPTVYFLLKRLEGNAVRNAVVAFHGGVLLLYISSLPVIWFDRGWLGLALVFESAALLWLNGRIVHPGLRWVSAAIAPAGLVLLLSNLGKMKGIDSLPILNGAVIATAMCIPALAAAVRMSDYPDRRLGPMDLPRYFLWLTLGAGFFLVNLSIADIFGESGQRLLYSIQRGFSHAVANSLAWAVFGAALWRLFGEYRAVRVAGIVVLVLGCARLLFSPFLFPSDIAGLRPLLNPELIAFVALAALLFYMYKKEPPGESYYGVRNLFLAFFLVCVFIGIKLAAGTVFQPGVPIRLFFGRTIAMATASAAGWFAYGFALVHWPKKLDPPFRTAGMVLAVLGLAKAAAIPFLFPVEFARVKPLLNAQTLLYVLCIAGTVFTACRKEISGWPFDKVSPRSFWAVLAGVFAFWVLNIEIASVFGDNRYGFDLATGGKFSHQLAYSLGWLCFAIGLLVLGIKIDHNRARWTALVMIVVTASKIFFKDLWSLGQLYRVTSFVGLAAVLILVSFLYQRYLAKGSKHEN